MSNQSSPPAAVIGLGANLGDARATLRAALRALQALTRRPLQVSSLYRSAPVGPPQPDYLNAAALLTVALDPVVLLDALQAIEAAHGRVRLERWGPRTLDLDLLWLEGRSLCTPRLTVPHPALCERAFALVPLLEVAPHAVDPRSGARLEDAVAGLSTEGLDRVAGPGWEEALPNL